MLAVAVQGEYAVQAAPHGFGETAAKCLAFAAALSGLPLPPAQDWRDPALPESLRRFHQADRRIDDAATRALLGWSPRHRSYREGLRALWAAGEGRPAEVPV